MLNITNNKTDKFFEYGIGFLMKFEDSVDKLSKIKNTNLCTKILTIKENL